jgi:two-component system sensor histidine kinase YesM
MIIPGINNMKMQKKLLLSYLIVVILPIFIIGSTFIANTKNIILDYINHINEITMNQVKTNIVNSFSSYIKVSDNILPELKLIEMLTKEYKSDSDYLNSYIDDMLVQLNKLLLVMPDSVKISFFSTNKTIVPDNNVVFYVDGDVSGQTWYSDAIKANGANVISLPYLNVNGKKVFSISRMLYSNSYNKKNVVMRIEVPLEKIDNLIKEEGKNKNIILLDDRNRVFTLSASGSLSAFYDVGEAFNSVDSIKENGEVVFNNEIFIVTEKSLADKGALKGWKIVSVISPDTIMNDINRAIMYSLVICLITVVITVVLISLFSYKLTSRLRILADSMKKIKEEDSLEVLLSYDGNDEIGQLSDSFKEMINRLNNLISEVYLAEIKVKDLELEKKEAEIHALQSQINPHFLFNTMESISMNSLNKGDLETAEIVRSFSKLLRRSIEWENDTTTLKHELDLVWDYLKIHKFRHKDKFRYEISIDQRFNNVCIPKFILQPVVENAIYHGLELKVDQGLLRIYARADENDLEIIVEDNGLGIKQEVLKNIQSTLETGEGTADTSGQRKGIGLSNIHQRLRLYYGGKYGIGIDSAENAGTKVVIRIPVKTDKGEDHV